MDELVDEWLLKLGLLVFAAVVYFTWPTGHFVLFAIFLVGYLAVRRLEHGSHDTMMIGGLLASGLVIAGHLGYLTWPVSGYLGAVVAAAAACYGGARLIASPAIPLEGELVDLTPPGWRVIAVLLQALSRALVAVTAGVFIVFVFDLIAVTWLDAGADQLATWEQRALDARRFVLDTLSIDLEILLIILIALVGLAALIPQLAGVKRLARLRSWIARIALVMVVVSSFTYFGVGSAERFEQRADRIEAERQAQIRWKRESAIQAEQQVVKEVLEELDETRRDLVEAVVLADMIESLPTPTLHDVRALLAASRDLPSARIVYRQLARDLAAGAPRLGAGPEPRGAERSVREWLDSPDRRSMSEAGIEPAVKKARAETGAVRAARTEARLAVKEALKQAVTDLLVPETLAEVADVLLDEFKPLRGREVAPAVNNAAEARNYAYGPNQTPPRWEIGLRNPDVPAGRPPKLVASDYIARAEAAEEARKIRQAAEAEAAERARIRLREQMYGPGALDPGRRYRSPPRPAPRPRPRPRFRP